MILETKKKKNF